MKKTERRFRRDRGISMVVVVLLFLFTIIIGFSALALSAKRAELNREKARLQQLKDVEREIGDSLRTSLAFAIAPTGLSLPETGILTSDLSSKEVDTRRDAIIKGVTGEPEPVVEYRKERYGTFHSLINEMGQRITVLQLRHQRAELQGRLARAFADAKTAARPEILKDKEAYKVRLAQMIKDVNDSINEITAKYTETKAGLTAQAEKLTTDIDTESAKARDEQRREDGKIRKMRNDLEQMKQKEVIKHKVNVTHGKVLRPDVIQKSAWIDLGSRERVVPGLRFMAVRMGKEGKFDYKALLEVKKVWLETSEVAIVKVYEGSGPVIDGDLIVNPFYNPKKPVIVAFAGNTTDRTFNLRLADNNPKPLRFSAREAANRIRELGSEPRMTVTLDADFVIFTEVSSTDTTRDSWPDYKKAVLLEIPIADAAEYYEFLGG